METEWMHQSAVVEVRCFEWMDLNMEVDITRLRTDPLAPAKRLQVSLPTSCLAEDVMDAVRLARQNRSSPASLAGLAVSSLDLVSVQASLWTLEHLCPVTGLTNARVAPGETKECGEGTLVLNVELVTPLGPGFLPHVRYPWCEGEVSFERALTIARTSRCDVVLNRVVEAQGWWYFPWRMIGSFGGVVSKTDGKLTHFGSAGKLEDWLLEFAQGRLAT